MALGPLRGCVRRLVVALGLTTVLNACGCSPRSEAGSGPSGPALPTASALAEPDLSATADPAPAPKRAVDVQGHRGARGLFPENTTEGFRAALSIGVSTLEMDLGVSRDGVVVVHHDERLNRDTTRDAQGQWLTPPLPTISDLSWTELQAFDVGRLRAGSSYAERFSLQRGEDDLRIPRLSDIIALAEQTTGGTIRYNLETKLSPLEPARTLRPTPFAQAVLDALRRAGTTGRTTVQSFDWRTLRHLHRALPALQTSCLTSESADFDTIQEGVPGPSPWTAGLDVDDFGGSVPRLVLAAGCRQWSPNADAAGPTAVAEAHRLGLTVAVWTVNEPSKIAEMLDRGVDGIISDYPDRVRAVLSERGWPLPRRYPGDGL